MSQTDMRPPVLGDLASGGEPTRRPPRLGTAGRLRLALLAYGVLFAIVGGMTLADDFKGSGDLPLMGTRVDMVHREIAAQKQGAPPFTVVLTKGKTFGDAAPSDLAQAGYGDDPGVYIALPIVHRLTGETDPVELMRTLYLAAFVLLFLLWPLILYEAFGSLAVALLGPLAALHGFRFTRMTDVYWIAGWILVLGLPVLFAAHRRWTRWTFGAVVAVTVAASFASAMRAQSGLPILIGGLALVLVHVATWKRRALGAAILLVAYLAVTPIGIRGVIAYRDHELGDRAFASRSGGHILWHPVFLGLGWAKNPWGIYWNDSFAANFARSKDPKAILPTARYDAVLRHAYLDDVTSQPGVVLRMYWRKGLVSLDIARRNATLGLGLAVVALAALFVPRLRRWRAMVLLVLPALALGLANEVLVFPAISYGMSFVTGVAILALLPIAWAVTFAEEQLRRRRSVELERLRRWRPVRGDVDVALVAAAGVIAFFVARDLVGPDAADAQRGSSKWQYHSLRGLPCGTTPDKPLLASDLSPNVVSRASFANGVPTGWSAVRPATVTRLKDGIAVRTAALAGTYNLLGPTMKLPAGTYTIALDGGVRAGGMTIGLLGVTSNNWVGQASFFGRCPTEPGTRLGLSHVTTGGEEVRVVLSNFDPSEERSQWLVRALTVRRD